MSPDSKVLLHIFNFYPIFRRLPDHLPRTPPDCQMQVLWCPVVLFVIRTVKSVVNGTQVYYVFSGWHRLRLDASGYHPDEKGARPSIQNCDLRPGRPRRPTHQAHQTQALIFADVGSSEAGEWKTAMEKEIASLERYSTLEATTPPVDRRFVDTKWVLRKKRDENGNLVKYKARLTARGFTQIPGIDYDETFSAVVRTDTLRILLAHAIQHNLHTAQFDIESAYLNAPLEEEIYIKPPKMVSVPSG